MTKGKRKEGEMGAGVGEESAAEGGGEQERRLRSCNGRSDNPG